MQLHWPSVWPHCHCLCLCCPSFLLTCLGDLDLDLVFVINVAAQLHWLSAWPPHCPCHYLHHHCFSFVLTCLGVLVLIYVVDVAVQQHWQSVWPCCRHCHLCLCHLLSTWQHNGTGRLHGLVVVVVVVIISGWLHGLIVALLLSCVVVTLSLTWQCCSIGWLCSLVIVAIVNAGAGAGGQCCGVGG